MASPNHYEVIGLDPSASQAEVESRYRELSRLYQLDGDSSGDGMASLIAEAYRVLANPSLRTVYDRSLGRPAQPESRNTEQPAISSPISSRVSVPALDSTQEIPPMSPSLSVSQVMDRTVAVAVSPANPEEEDRRLAAELSRRGIPPDEVRRLVALGKHQVTAPTTPNRAAPVTALPLPPPPSWSYVPKPTIALPPFRESSVQDRAEADRLLTSANIARRRDKFREAEALCLKAVDLVPSDSAALELYGDILQATGRVDDAVLAYKSANEADPSRRSAEKKYGDLVLRQDRSIAFIQNESIPGNRKVFVLLGGLVIVLSLVFAALLVLRMFFSR